jgi:hypothetical protein
MVTSTYPTLPPAVYRTSTNSNGEIILEPVKQNSDDVFDLPGLPIEEVTERIEKFWAQADVYESFNFVQLADRFIKRPGRFDLVIGMDVPSEITRRGYFQKILRDDAHPKLDYLVSKTEGMALAHLREIASSYLCLGIPVDETVARLRTGVNMAFKPTKAYGKVEGLGFSVGCIKTRDEMEGK